MGPTRSAELDYVDFVRTAGADHWSAASGASVGDSRVAVGADGVYACQPGETRCKAHAEVARGSSGQRRVSGHPMLVPGALEAVSQWRYRPYVLNGEAIEVETQITVNFVLAGN